MDVEFTFVSEPMPYGRFANRPKTEQATREAQKRKRRNSLPKWIVQRLRDCRWEEPVNDRIGCTVNVYRRTCPIETCEYMSGKYVSHESALRALLGHLRWVHNYG